MTAPPCQTPSVMSPTARTLSGRGVLDRARRNSPRQSRPDQRPGCGHRAVVRRELEGALAIRPAGDVLMGGAPGAGSLRLNTKASQEAACSCAPSAIAPGPEPESRDEGVSRFVGNGSHLEATGAAEGLAGHVDGPGGSGNAGIGSHLAEADVAEGLAGGVPPGVNENGQVGRWDVGKGKARAALSARKYRQRYMAICPV